MRRPPLPRAPFPLGPRRTTPLPNPERRDVALPCGDVLRVSTSGDPDGPLLVAVHGFRGSDMGLGAVLAPLDGFRVVSPNLPGMGVSDVVPGVRYDLDRLVTDVAEVIRALSEGPVLLLGHSFGTVVVSAVAARHPELVRGLVLLAPILEPVHGRGLNALGTDALTLFFRGVARAPERVGTRVIDSKFPGEQSLPFLRRRSGSWQRVQQLSHEALPSSFDRQAVLDAHLAATGRGCAEFVDAIQVPTAVVVGDRDQFSTVAMARSFVGRLTDGRLALVPGAGHLMHYEHVEEVSAALADVLAGLDG